MQAVAAAEAGASYVAPYVGRVSDWQGDEGDLALDKEEDLAKRGLERGVLLARDIQLYYKMEGHGTKVMAASIRGPPQVKALTGCDILTIST